MVNSIEYPIYNKSTRQMLADKGFTHVMVSQGGDAYALHVNDESKAGAPWGNGLYRLNSDGTLGDCVHFNFDSSD